jgi:hypothetical protein
MNISSWLEGWYLVYCKFEHRYGVGQGPANIDLALNNWFRLDHIITVTKPILDLTTSSDGADFYLNITNVTAWCSQEQLGSLNDSEPDEHKFIIKNLTNDNQVLDGILIWSAENQTWQAIKINISQLPSGRYYVLCGFNVKGVGYGENSHDSSDDTEFSISKTDNGEPRKENGEEDDYNQMDLITIVIIIIIIIIILLILSIFIYPQKGKK